MSMVRSAVILTDWVADKSIITEPVNFDNSHEGRGFVEISMEEAGGYKHMECDVFAMALNYITSDVLETWFMGLPWAKEDHAILVWHGPHGDFGSVERKPRRAGGSYTEHLRA